MRTTLLFSLLIVISLTLQTFPAADRVAAQDSVVRWELHEVRVNPHGVVPRHVKDSRAGVSGREIRVNDITITQSTANSMSYTWYREDLDGNILWSQAFSFVFSPPEFLTQDPFKITVSGSATCEQLVEGVFVPNCIGGIRMWYGLADSQGTSWAYTPNDTWLEVGSRTSPSVSEQLPPWPITARLPTSPDQTYRIEFQLMWTCKTEDGGESPLVVAWIYKPVELEKDPTEEILPDVTITDEPEDVEEPVKETREPMPGQPETLQESMERAIIENLVGYIDMFGKFEKDLYSLYSRAEAILENMQDARWFLSHGFEEDKERARAEITRLEGEMKNLLEEFNSRASRLEEVLANIEAQFVAYEQKKELMETLQGFKSQLNLTRINLVLRSGNVEDFDELFRQYREDPNIADQVLVGNAFRRLMTGDTRTALESAKLALEKNKDNPTAQQLIRDLELHYMDIIRDKLAGEQSVNAKLFNAKLNGHGQEGVGGFLLDVLTTGVGESFQALAGYMEIYLEKGAQGLGEAGYQAVSKGQHPKGYYDFLQEVSSLNIDEATAQIAGIQFVKTLRQHGITLDEMSEMTVPRLQEIIVEKFDGRVISEEEATILRKRIWDAFKNPDMETLRKGRRTQLDVDIGRDYFDTEVLQPGMSDTIMKQFSAWDTFLKFAPSAQLGSISKMGVAQRLGLKADTTLQQALQKGLMIEELGQRLYQTKAGAAVIDATYQWNGFTEMVSQAVKNRVGEVAYAAGSTAVQTALDQMSAPVKEALTKELLQISDYYLGAENTATVEATVDTLSNFFGFIGLNAEALQRGAYGVEDLEKAKAQIQAELTQRQALANNPGIAQVSNRPASFNDFETRVTSGGEAYLRDLGDARDRIKGAAGSLSDQRGSIVTQGDKALQQMEEAAKALQRGDRTEAQRIFESMQSSAGRNFDFVNQENIRKLGGATDTMRIMTTLASKSPTDRDFAAEVTKMAMSFTSGAESGAVGEFKDLTDTLIATGFRIIPE